MSGPRLDMSMDANKDNIERPAGDGLVAFVLVPLVLCSLFATVMSCMLVFEYRDKAEWASTSSTFRPYDVGVPEKVPAIAPVPVSLSGKPTMSKEKVPMAQN